jgi:hypothetical protein
MKKILFGLTLVAAVSVTNVNAQGQGVATGAAPATAVSVKAAPAPVISFPADKHEFGAVPQGTPVTHEFSFKNTGAVPLVLSNVSTECGCTTPEWPKEPIAPNATAKIKVIYNAANLGDFTKRVTVMSNASVPQIILTIHGEVKPVATANQATAPKTTTPVQSAAPKKS